MNVACPPLELEILLKTYQALALEHQTLKTDYSSLQEEASDLKILYEGSIEHSVAIENMLADKNEQLECTQKRLKEELTQASNYLCSLFPKPMQEKGIETEWHYLSSTEIGGDAFGYHWMDASHFAFYLFDVCGHGVGAALLSSTVIQMMKSQALKHVDFHNPAQVLQGLNEAFQMDQQNNMFFTLWYGIYSTDERLLSYASAGHPPALLYSLDPDQNLIASQLGSPQMIIGYDQETQYTFERCTIPPNANLFIFSDGVFEIQSQKDQRMWAFNDFKGFLKEKVRQTPLAIKNIVQDLQKIQNSEHFEDDFSLMHIHFN